MQADSAYSDLLVSDALLSICQLHPDDRAAPHVAAFVQSLPRHQMTPMTTAEEVELRDILAGYGKTIQDRHGRSISTGEAA